MPSAPVLQIEALLGPIEGDNPAGQDISTSGIISDLKELRRSDEEGNYGDWAPKEMKSADWPKVIKVATDALTKRSKDLRIAAYLVEAATKQHGLVGLRDGLVLVREMHLRYWDNVYPLIEDEDADFRAGAVGLLDGLLPMRIKEQKVTKSMGGTVYSQLDWEESKRVDQLERTNQDAFKQALSDGKVTGEMFRKAVTTTPKSFYEKFISDLDECLDLIKETNLVIEDKYGGAHAAEIPVLSQTSKTLESTKLLSQEVEKLVGAIRAASPGETAEEPGEADGGGAAAPGARAVFTGPGVPLDPVDREDALRRLTSVANYFRKAEPHSPIAYILDRAVSWGRMPLEKWLEEVVKDAGTLGNIRELLGIKPPESSY